MEQEKNLTLQRSQCPVAYTLQIIGGKWSLPIVWQLGQAKCVRYNELRRRLDGISNMMLAKCLRELETHGIVTRIQHNEVPPRVEYSLSEKGRSLQAALTALANWGRAQMASGQGDTPSDTTGKDPLK